MRLTWVAMCWLVGIVALTAGCRTMPPDLKPPKQPDIFSVPPLETRYNTAVYPKEAFNTQDLFKKRDAENAIQPARGSMGNPGMMMNQNQRTPY